MQIIDISLPMHSGMSSFPGDPSFSIQRVVSADPADPRSFNLSALSLGTHTGTHVDAPLHLQDGRPAITDLPLDALCGPAHVLDLRGKGMRITASILASSNVERAKRLLLKTDSSAVVGGPFVPEYSYLAPDAATFLRDVGMLLVGIDSWSVDPWEHVEGDPYAAHRILLIGSRPVVVLEGLDLRGVAAGDYELWCLPLRVVGADGAPARAVLVRR